MHRTKLATAVACALLALAGCGGGGHGGRKALPAWRFVDSIGVNVHMSFTDTAYRNVAAVRAAVRELGVHHVRDGLVLGRPDQYAALKALADDGVRPDLILGDPLGRSGTGTLGGQVATVGAQLAGVPDTVEGPNEYDHSGDPSWPLTLRRYQLRLYGQLHRDPELVALQVVGPSLIDTSAWPRVGDLTSAEDYANVHSYAAGQPPGAGPLAEQLRQVRASSRGRPVFVTETGYHNAVNAPPSQQPGVPESVAATYLPTVLLDAFGAGVERTFVYELADQHPEPAATQQEQHFGLVRTDFSRKPAFVSLRNLIALLSDPGSPHDTGSLDYSVRAPAGVRSVLLEKRDGRFYLALWRPDAAVWSTSAKRPLVAPRVRVEVRLGKRAALLRSYDPVRSSAPGGTLRNADAVSLELGADPLVLEIG